MKLVSNCLFLSLTLLIAGCGPDSDFDVKLYNQVARTDPFPEMPNSKWGPEFGRYDSGKKRVIRCFNDENERHGPTIGWYESGQKMFEKNYKDGKLDGLYTYWYENTHKDCEILYEDGKRVQSAFWTELGVPSEEPDFRKSQEYFKDPNDLWLPPGTIVDTYDEEKGGFQFNVEKRRKLGDAD